MFIDLNNEEAILAAIEARVGEASHVSYQFHGTGMIISPYGEHSSFGTVEKVAEMATRVRNKKFYQAVELSGHKKTFEANCPEF